MLANFFFEIINFVFKFLTSVATKFHNILLLYLITVKNIDFLNEILKRNKF